MTLEEIRRLVIVAMFSDDVLLEKLVLKGGNALDLLYAVGTRSSLDIDFSIEADFSDSDNIEQRIFAALRDRFESRNLTTFDEKFERKIPPNSPDRTLGYKVYFKIIENSRALEIQRRFSAEDRRREQMQREATVVGPAQQRIFKVDISNEEFCDGKREMSIDDYVVYVYPPEMIAIEKLRAICQQMSEYSLRSHPCPRARDFYDIHAIVSTFAIDLRSSDNINLVRSIFAAKDVPLSLLGKVNEYREFHRPDWPAVENAVERDLRNYDYYFDFVVEIAAQLETFGIMEPPR